MAITGLSRLWAAKYAADADGNVTYTGGNRFAKARSVTITPATADANYLYADNGVAEMDKSASGGTVSIEVDDLSDDAVKFLLGVQTSKVTVDGKEVDELVYDDTKSAPYVGFGCIIQRRKDGTDKYSAVVLTKVMFSDPENAATTKEENIEWQTPTIEGDYMRDDTATHRDRRTATFDTEAEAEAYIKTCLDITNTASGASD